MSPTTNHDTTVLVLTMTNHFKWVMLHGCLAINSCSCSPLLSHGQTSAQILIQLLMGCPSSPDHGKYPDQMWQNCLIRKPFWGMWSNFHQSTLTSHILLVITAKMWHSPSYSQSNTKMEKGKSAFLGVIACWHTHVGVVVHGWTTLHCLWNYQSIVFDMEL